MNKERIGCVVSIVVLIGFFVWTYSINLEKREAKETAAETRNAEKRRRDAEKERIKDEFKTAFNELAGRHNAILDWTGIHQNENRDERIFTIELQDALQKLGDRTAIFVSPVADVFRTDDGFRILCHYQPYNEGLVYDSDADWSAANVTFLLGVNEATARHLVELHSEAENEDPYATQFFAIAVLVKRTTVTLGPKYYAIGEIVEAGTYEVDQETEAEVEEGGLRSRVLITGSCLEIIHLEGYDPFAL